MTIDLHVIRDHFSTTISKTLSDPSVPHYPDPLVCHAAEFATAWSALMDGWRAVVESRRRTPQLPQALILSALKSAAGGYVQRIETLHPELWCDTPKADLTYLRRRAADAHPDRGGDAAQFQVLYEEYRRVKASVSA